MKANAGAGFCSMTGRCVSLSHAATAPPREFRIPFWLPLGEGRLTTFWVPRCGIRGCGAQDSCPAPGVTPFGIASGLCRRVSVDAGAVATGFEQRKAQCILAGQKGATRQAVAVAGDPITPKGTFDIEMIGWVDTERNKICMRVAKFVSRSPTKGRELIKFRARSYSRLIKI